MSVDYHNLIDRMLDGHDPIPKPKAKHHPLDSADKTALLICAIALLGLIADLKDMLLLIGLVIIFYLAAIQTLLKERKREK
jgi:hypothetical protein